jgi:hypothetical protein
MSDVLRLEVPARAEALSLVRLCVAGAAAMTGAMVAEIEDLQLATEELCLSLLPNEPAGEDRLAVEVEWDDASVLVRCRVAVDLAERRREQDASDALPAGIVDRILDALVEEHGTSVVGDDVVAWLRVRRGPSPEGA